MSPRFHGANDYLCHCLRVSEGTLRQLAAVGQVRSLDDVKRHTGAGEGCTGCHRRIQEFLAGGECGR
ncbi:MAG: (2Fe-2S)-binding protein [Pirellulales bacterium]|nr:(2Fe-2S)-binding protein [Pirellulales bacterium]